MTTVTTSIVFVEGMENVGSAAFTDAEKSYCNIWEASLGSSYQSCKVLSFKLQNSVQTRRKRVINPLTAGAVLVDATIGLKKDVDPSLALRQGMPIDMVITKVPGVSGSTFSVSDINIALVMTTSTTTTATTNPACPWKNSSRKNNGVCQCDPGFKEDSTGCVESGSFSINFSL